MHVPEDVFRERLRERFYDPKFDAASAQVEQLIGIAWQVYSESHKSPRTRAAGQGFADPTMQLSVQWLATRDAIAAAQRAARRSGRAIARAVDLRLGAQRPDLSGRDVEDVPTRDSRRAACSTSFATSSVDLLDLSRLTCGVRPQYLSVQGVRLDRDAAVPLAVLVLPESRARPGAGLDGRDLPALGRRARRHDRHAGLLVPGAEHAEADDRPAGVRRRRQSRSDLDWRQGRREGQGARAGRLAVSASPRGPRFFRRRARRRRGCRGAASLAHRLARRPATDFRAGPAANIDRYVGYYEPYATSHDALDEEAAFHEEVRNAARALMGKVRELRGGKRFDAGQLEEPRPK